MLLHHTGRLRTDGTFGPVLDEVGESTARRLREGFGAYVGVYGATRRPDMTYSRVYESLAVDRLNRDAVLDRIGVGWDHALPADMAAARLEARRLGATLETTTERTGR